MPGSLLCKTPILSIRLATLIGYSSKLTDAIKLKAISHAGMHHFETASKYFTEVLRRREKEGDNGKAELASDYLDYGNYFLNQLNDYRQALNCYNKSISLSAELDDHTITAKAYTNIAQAQFRFHHLQDSKENYFKAFDLLNIEAPHDFLQNAGTQQLLLVSNKDLLLVFLNNKTEVLLTLYKETGEKKWLTACLQTALVTDSVITQTRHLQLGEQSKLYWRNSTHSFFGIAIEACYLARNTALAFYFMEKSRAVLLYDKLNELSAAGNLPPNEKEKEETLQVKLVEQQLKLASLSSGTPQYTEVQTIFLQTKSELDRFIKSLEQRYPMYYQYKYADHMPSVAALQQYLSGNQPERLYSIS